MTMRNVTHHGRIDVHHHLIPPAFVEAMNRRGIRQVAGAPLPGWTPAKSLAVMDATGIGTALLSLSAPGVYFGDEQEARTLARACNEHAASVAQDHPSRFGFFGVLPMPFIAHACEEAAYALDVLKADGIVLLGSTDGKFLGDPSFDELMAELDRRGATVFVHPNLHATSEAIGLDMPGFLIEFLCDTTRAALNLILSGTAERYPRIRWILAHAGGFLPYVAWRVSLANAMPQFSDRAPQGVLTYIRRFYFDTALSPSAYSMSALRELVEPSHILFGSDFPFAPAPITQVSVQTLERSTIWGDAVKQQIDRGNALALFPRWRQTDEQGRDAPQYGREPLGNWVRRQMIKPVGALAERMRNR